MKEKMNILIAIVVDDTIVLGSTRFNASNCFICNEVLSYAVSLNLLVVPVNNLLLFAVSLQVYMAF